MHLVIVIPCLNEERTIADVISAIPNDFDMITKRTVLVIDDGSTDNTVTCAEEAGACVIRHPYNKGVGAAFHTGINTALELHADIIVNMDGDGQFNPEDIRQLIAPIAQKKADFVTASRFCDPALVPQMPKIKIWGNRRIAHLVSMLIKKKIYDVSCGFRAYSKEAALKLNLFGTFTYTQETFLDLAFKGLSIEEIPIRVQGVRSFGKSRVAHNLYAYAFNTSRIILRTYRDYKPLHFFSIIACVVFFISIIPGGFITIHYILSGRFYPHKWAGFLAVGLLALSILFFITGIVAEILARIRDTTENILYYQKKNYYYPHEKNNQNNS